MATQQSNLSRYGKFCNIAYIAVAITVLVVSSNVWAGYVVLDTGTTEPCGQADVVDEIGRKYVFPSIMVERDRSRPACVNGKYKHGLIYKLIINSWTPISDRIVAPSYEYQKNRITYLELQQTLNFHDEDVVTNPKSVEGEPDASIVTPWLVCNIFYIDKHFTGTDKSVLLDGVVIDIEEKKVNDARIRLEEKYGIFLKLYYLLKGGPH